MEIVETEEQAQRPAPMLNSKIALITRFIIQ